MARLAAGLALRVILNQPTLVILGECISCSCQPGSLSGSRPSAQTRKLALGRDPPRPAESVSAGYYFG